jgi:hypothetical protein
MQKPQATEIKINLFCVQSYDKRPLLRDVSKIVRDYSFDNFGIMNDRYVYMYQCMYVCTLL